jgi:hypothetical protein
LSKLARRVSYPFTGEQPVLPPTGHLTVPSKEDVIAFYRTHERVGWSLTEILDLDWRDIRIDALTQTDIDVVETVMLVESNNPDYVANLIEYFKADQDVCDFIMMWAIEEWKHYYALREYLAKVQIALEARDTGDGADADRVAAIEAAVHRALGQKVGDVREASGENWGIPAHYVPVQVVASTTLQEFMTAEFYRHHARHTQEPVLAKLESLLAKDETRHEMFYEQRMKDALEADPGLMPMIVEALKEFGMPGAYLLEEYTARQAAMEDAAYPTLADKKAAFVALFSKMERIVGRENALRVFTEGNYMGEGDEGAAPKKKMRPELITRLITRKLSA